jgi:WD40 repeat protein
MSLRNYNQITLALSAAIALVWSACANSAEPVLRAGTQKNLGPHTILSCAMVNNEVVACLAGNELCLYDTLKQQTVEISVQTEVNKVPYCMTYLPENRAIAVSAADGTIQFWDPLTKKSVRSVSVGEDSHYQIRVSPDGTTLAAGSHDGIVRLVSVGDDTKRIGLMGHTRSVLCVGFSNDGSMLASGGTETSLILWDVAKQCKIKAFPANGAVNCIAFSADDRLVVSGDSAGELVVNEIGGSGRTVATRLGRTRLGNESINALIVHPNGRYVIAAAGSYHIGREKESLGFIFVFDLKEYKLIETYKTESNVHSLCLTPDKKRIVSGERNGTITIWELAK